MGFYYIILYVKMYFSIIKTLKSHTIIDYSFMDVFPRNKVFWKTVKFCSTEFVVWKRMVIDAPSVHLSEMDFN